MTFFRDDQLVLESTCWRRPSTRTLSDGHMQDIAASAADKWSTGSLRTMVETEKVTR